MLEAVSNLLLHGPWICFRPPPFNKSSSIQLALGGCDSIPPTEPWASSDNMVIYNVDASISSLLGIFITFVTAVYMINSLLGILNYIRFNRGKIITSLFSIL